MYDVYNGENMPILMQQDNEQNELLEDGLAVKYFGTDVAAKKTSVAWNAQRQTFMYWRLKTPDMPTRESNASGLPLLWLRNVAGALQEVKQRKH